MDSTQASAELRELVLDAAHDLKAVDVVALEVSDMTDITDTMIVAGGTSDRHVKAIVDNVLAVLKGAGKEVLGVEGRDVGGWVLLDLGDVVLHVMRAEGAQLLRSRTALGEPRRNDGRSGHNRKQRWTRNRLAGQGDACVTPTGRCRSCPGP